MAPEFLTGPVVQRATEARPDVLTYETAPLSAPVEIAGQPMVNLFASTSGTDSDWVVKLIDVYPQEYPENEKPGRGADVGPPSSSMAGYEMLVRGNPLRGKFRNGFEKPVPFEPGRPAAVKFAMPDVCHTFRSGHRIMVQVQSSWFPLVDRNPQTFCDIYSCDESAFKKQTHAVHRSASTPSKVTLRVRP